jgi:predicted unusual protein kinase regulating ubiquinone biosynthesis (AarF/ABC1/UbiB family)
VHKATLREAGGRVARAGDAVAVKVQNPGAAALMALDLQNLRGLAFVLQRTDLKFDLLSAVSELGAQVATEFDFAREARCMDHVAARLHCMRRRLVVPRAVPGLVTRRVLVMTFLDGIQVTRLRDRLASPAAARAATSRILGAVTEAYGRMIFTPGPFQADNHPGNLLVMRRGVVGLLDFGQCKELSDAQRRALARLFLALRAGGDARVAAALRDVGVATEHEDAATQAAHARGMFGTSGALVMDPFGASAASRCACALGCFRSAHRMMPSRLAAAARAAEDSPLKANPITAFPRDLFFVMRVVQLMRGLAHGMGVPAPCVADAWAPFAAAALR